MVGYKRRNQKRYSGRITDVPKGADFHEAWPLAGARYFLICMNRGRDIESRVDVGPVDRKTEKGTPSTGEKHSTGFR